MSNGTRLKMEEITIKKCPSCGEGVIPRVVGELIEIPEHQQYNTKKFVEEEYFRRFQYPSSQRLLCCSKCSWARNFNIGDV